MQQMATNTRIIINTEITKRCYQSSPEVTYGNL